MKTDFNIDSYNIRALGPGVTFIRENLWIGHACRDIVRTGLIPAAIARGEDTAELEQYLDLDGKGSQFDAIALSVVGRVISRYLFLNLTPDDIVDIANDASLSIIGGKRNNLAAAENIHHLFALMRTLLRHRMNSILYKKVYHDKTEVVTESDYEVQNDDGEEISILELIQDSGIASDTELARRDALADELPARFLEHIAGNPEISDVFRVWMGKWDGDKAPNISRDITAAINIERAESGMPPVTHQAIGLRMKKLREMLAEFVTREDNEFTPLASMLG